MTSKLTREELRERAKENISNLRLASKQRAFESMRKEILADLLLAEYALEAMESEPYGFTESERHGMVLEPRKWPTMEVKEPPLHIKEQPAPVVPMELRNSIKAEALAEMLRDAHENMPLAAAQWEVLAKNWHQTFLGLSGEENACHTAMLNGGKS
ncbi:TPA: hypothetical protein ACHSON_004016 [Raoultella planticola ATCC 33531]